MAGNSGAVGGPSPIGVESSLKGTYQAAGVQETMVLPGTKQTQQKIDQQQSGGDNNPKKPDAFSNKLASLRPGSPLGSAKNKEESKQG